MSRPPLYSPDLAEEICIRIAMGRSTSSVGADEDMPERETIQRWRWKHPEFREMLAQAREDRTESFAEKMHDLAERVIDELDLDHNRVNSAVSAYDKAARLMSDKRRVEVTGKDGGALRVEDASDPRLIARQVAFLLAKGASE